jgi:serine/threonine-protein kinase RsbT
MATPNAFESITKTESLPLRAEQDIVLARQVVRRLTQELGFSLVDQTKMVTAASELARNAVVYGLGGTLTCELLTNGLRKGLRLRFEDHGPGIENLELAMTDGWTSGQGLGLGLSGARRLVNEFAIKTAPGQGTTVTIVRWA